MEKNSRGFWIVDELILDPHLSGCVVARDGAAWYILSQGREPRAYKAKVSPEYMRLTWNHEYYINKCAPRDGYTVTIGRAITADEWADLVRDQALTDDDISDSFDDTVGAIYGPEAAVTYTARQVRIKDTGIVLEQRLLALGIQASNGSPSRVNIRIESTGSAARALGSKGGSVHSEAQKAAARAAGKAPVKPGSAPRGRPSSKKSEE